MCEALVGGCEDTWLRAPGLGLGEARGALTKRLKIKIENILVQCF